MGGDCLATGCVPSKAILRSARLQADLRNADALGATAQATSDAFPAVMERMRRLRAKLSLHDSVHGCGRWVWAFAIARAWKSTA